MIIQNNQVKAQDVKACKGLIGRSNHYFLKAKQFGKENEQFGKENERK